MRKTAANDDLLTTRQVGDMLGVAVRTVQLWVESGSLPAWRTAGGHRRIARSAVEKLVQERALVAISDGKTDSAAVPVHVATAAKGGPLRLLVVEDDPILRKLMSTMVEAWDFPVNLRTANDGFEGLLVMGQFMPDVVVTDLNMPGMDGFEMLRSITRPGSGFEDVRLIVTSSYTEADIRDRGGLPPGVQFFLKPVRFEALANAVREGRLERKTG